jgi:hypothetical protein
MPRGKKSDIFTAVRAQAARALKLLQDEIRQRQADLAKMVAQAESWRALLGGGGPARSAGAAAGGRRGGRRRGGKRVSWDEVLASVPSVFGIEHVLKHPGAASKGRAQIYPAFTRWEAAGRIKRVAKGRYEKTGATAGRAGATKAARKPARKARGKRRRAAAKPRAKKAAQA